MKKETLWRIVIYVSGAMLLSMGAVLGTRTGLGLSCVNSVGFSLNSAFGISYAQATFCFYTLTIILQFIIRGKHRRWRDLLQLPFNVCFSSMVGVFDGLFRWTPEALPGRIFLFAVASVMMCLGLCLMVNMQLVPNPPDGLANAIAWALKKDLGLGKNILDIGCVTFSFLVDVLFGTIWTSIGVATVIAVVAYGRLVYLFNRLLKVKLLALAGLSPEN